MRYRLKRLSFRLQDAKDAFQRQIDAKFGNVQGIAGIADDQIVFGFKHDVSDHDMRLHDVLKRAREKGIRFNKDKMVIRVPC